MLTPKQKEIVELFKSDNADDYDDIVYTLSALVSKPQKALAPFIAALLNHSDRMIVREAVRALVEAGVYSNEIFRELIFVLRNSRNEYMTRMGALRAMCQINLDKASFYVIESLGDPHPKIRSAAIIWIHKSLGSDKEETFKLLSNIFWDEKDEYNQIEIIKTIAYLNIHEARDFFIEIANDKNVGERVKDKARDFIRLS